jgi:hypothetical protein
MTFLIGIGFLLALAGIIRIAVKLENLRQARINLNRAIAGSPVSDHDLLMEKYRCDMNEEEMAQFHIENWR